MPKAAGTSVTELLRKHYSADKVIDCVFLQDYQKHDQEHFEKFLLYKGHIHYDFARRNFPADTQYLTVLREPVERVLSQYFYIRNTPESELKNPSLLPGQRKAVELAKTLGIRDFLMVDFPNIRRSTRNQQLRILSKPDWFNANEDDSDALVASALKTLESFACVGVQSLLPFFVLEVCDHFGLDASGIPQVNTNPSKIREFQKIPKQERDEVTEMIRHFNAAEIAVYNQVKERIYSKLNRLVSRLLVTGGFHSLLAD